MLMDYQNGSHMSVWQVVIQQVVSGGPSVNHVSAVKYSMCIIVNLGRFCIS